ncbi:MAG: DUF4080 domain-containing protein [Ruminococcaceae bacterium]|nr:DUF4080 domain-containing protein [Oscillospiraceae bacterium]
MKTLICAINSKFIHSSLAVHSLSASCKFFSGKYCAETGDMSVKEFSVNDPYDTIVYGIVSECPDIVALSVYIWNVKLAGELISDLRKMLPDCLIILGGPEVSFGLPGNIINDGDFDHIICGEGEYSFFRLVANIHAAKENKLIELPETSECDFNELPFVYSDENLPLFENRIIYYETSRGCPFNCAYCLSGADSKVKFLDIERVFREIDFFCKHKVPQVKFVDRTFNCNPKRAKTIVRYIASIENCETNFHFEVGADLFDNEFIEILSTVPVGRVQIEAGIQSMQPEVLDACCRKTDTRKCFENLIQIVSNGNINVHTDLIAGLPYETVELFKDSFNKTYSLKSHQLQLGFLKLLKGAPLNDMLDEHAYTFSERPPYEVVSNKYISHKELLLLKEVEDALEKYYNSGHYSISLEIIEKHFETPFEMYEAMAEFLKSKNLIFKPMSLRQSFDIMYLFASGFVDGGELHNLRKMLLVDYFSSNKTDLPPDSLKELWKPERSMSSKSGDIMKFCGIDDFKAHRLRIIDNEIYIFNVSEPNSVTGRFSYIKALNGI